MGSFEGPSLEDGGIGKITERQFAAAPIAAGGPDGRGSVQMKHGLSHVGDSNLQGA